MALGQGGGGGSIKLESSGLMGRWGKGGIELGDRTNPCLAEDRQERRGWQQAEFG